MADRWSQTIFMQIFDTDIVRESMYRIFDVHKIYNDVYCTVILCYVELNSFDDRTEFCKYW